MIPPGLPGPPFSDVVADAVAWRHHLHRHPELAFQERSTADFIAARLTEFGLKIDRGLAGTGVVGTLARGTGRRTIGIRADMDALPIQENSCVSHASSTAGVMHACGHDGHVAIALAAARMCARLPDLDGTVHFIFQPAEESEGGAQQMIHDGLFQRFPCDSIYALHNWPALPVGTCAARDDAMMAALAVFEIKLIGRGCHGAMPHEGVDPVLAGCQLVAALQSIVSRNIDPLQAAVVSVTSIHAGDGWSVIPETCVIRGTTRWFDEEVGALLERRVVALANSISAGLACQAEVSYQRRYPATVNDASRAGFLREVAAASPVGLAVADVRPCMTAEDFAFMLRAVPGCYLWLGSGKPDNHYGLHSSKYDFNDEVIPAGVALWTSLVSKSLVAA